MNFEIHTVDPIRFFVPRRLDIIIKRWLFAYWLNGGDPEIEKIYSEHIDKRAGATLPLHVYLPKARRLFESMRLNGFQGEPIPVNRNWELLDGAHRIGLASVLGCQVKVAKIETDHLWPDWGAEWFVENGMTKELPLLLRALHELRPSTPLNMQSSVVDTKRAM